MAAPPIIEKILQQFRAQFSTTGAPEYILLTKKHSSNWQSNPASIFSRADNKGFKYDIFSAEHPANLKNNKNPRDFNILSESLASQGYEVYAFADREKGYRKVAALKAFADGD
ncbi:MAG: hypothetical protein MUF61_01035 [archaeon]|jgi:hypothetical protein|nr:hypothetical protein [archaeon]